MERELLSVDQAANRAGASRQSIYHWVKQGITEAVREMKGRKVRLYVYADTLPVKRSMGKCYKPPKTNSFLGFL